MHAATFSGGVFRSACDGGLSFLLSFVVGVGHFCTELVRDLCWSISDFFASLLTGVGQDEHTLSAVGRSHIRRAETTPLRSEPRFGQVSKDNG